MKEYERITKRTKFGVAIEFSSNEFKIPYCDDIEAHYALERLAELEDKIENGTLIDTKVKVGQRVYMRGFWKGDFDEYIVSNIRLDNGELKISLKHDFDEGKTCYSTTIIGLDEIGETVFLTKAEAKEKLKELKGEV